MDTSVVPTDHVVSIKRNLLYCKPFRHRMSVVASGIESAGVTERSPEIKHRSIRIKNTDSGPTLASDPAAGAIHHNTHGRGCSMSETTRKAGTTTRSVPADVTAAMAELHDVLDGLAGLNIPILTGIAKDAKRAATVCTDALLDMASEMAVSA